MDRMLYVAMTGAKQTMRAQTVNNHNLANASTTGFRADLARVPGRAVEGSGYAIARLHRREPASASTHSQGALHADGPRSRRRGPRRRLDRRAGTDGTEAYTRAGDLQRRTRSGCSQTERGELVLGDGGPVAVPPYTLDLRSRSDGTISIVPQGQGPETLAQVGRIKLVNPDAEHARASGDDGLFRMKDGKPMRRRCRTCSWRRARSRPATSTWPSHGQHDRARAPFRSAGANDARRRTTTAPPPRSSLASLN